MPTDEDNKRINETWEYACYICTRYLSVIMHIQPFQCGAREEQLNSLTVGLIHTRLVDEVESFLFTVRRDMIDNNSRLNALKHFVFGKNIEQTPYANVSSLKH